MARVNIGMLTFQEQNAIKGALTENDIRVIEHQVEDDLIKVGGRQQEIETIQQAMNNAEEVIREAEEEREALQRAHGVRISVGLASFQRAVKSFERRTGVTYGNLGFESSQRNNIDSASVKIATEGIVAYVKKLIRMLIDALNSLWEKVKAFFKNLFSGAEKLHKRAEKIKEATTVDENKEEYRKKPEIINGTYYPSSRLKKLVESGENVSIQNALIMELNNTDTETEELLASLDWVLNKRPEAIEKYQEKKFARGMDNDRNKWDKKYYMVQEVYISTNFAKERYIHMIKVREYLREKGVRGFVRRKDIKVDDDSTAKSYDRPKNNDHDYKITTPSVLEFAVLDGKAVEGSAFVDKYIKQATDSSLYRESLNDDIKDLSSGAYAKILEAAKKNDNKDEIIKLIKDCAEGPTRKEGAVLNNKDGFVTYSSQKDIYFLGDYYDENTNVAKDATWEQISGGHSKINSDLIHDRNQKKIAEVIALTREESNTLAAAAMTAMENYKKIESQEKKLDTGFNKLLSEIKRLESDESIPTDQLRVAGGFIRSSINATIKMLVALNAYELRLTKAALDYAAASLNINSAA